MNQVHLVAHVDAGPRPASSSGVQQPSGLLGCPDTARGRLPAQKTWISFCARSAGDEHRVSRRFTSRRT